MKKRFLWLVITSVVMVWAWIVSQGLSLISQPSDLDVVAGLGIIGLSTVGAPSVIRCLIHKVYPKKQEKNI